MNFVNSIEGGEGTCYECLHRFISIPLYQLDQTAVRRISQRFSKSDVPKQPSGHETTYPCDNKLHPLLW